MKVLITGAAGFLGSHLCETLVNKGHQVIGMDNFITGSIDNLAHIAGREEFTFIKHDVANFIFVPGQVDFVLHFASPASPNPNSPYGYPNLPIQTMKAGALGTHNTLGVAAPIMPSSCSPRPARSTAIPSNTPKRKPTGVIVIPSAPARFTMKPNVLPKP